MAIQSVTIVWNSSVVMPAWVAMTISTRPFSPAAASAFMSPSSTALNGCVSFHSGMLRRQRLDPVEGEGELGVHRLLGPQRAVIVEHGDALGFGHEVGRAFRRSLSRRRRRWPPWPGRRSTRADGSVPGAHARWQRAARPPAPTDVADEPEQSALTCDHSTVLRAVSGARRSRIGARRPRDGAPGRRARTSVAGWHRDVDAFLRELLADPLEPLVVRKRDRAGVAHALQLARRILHVGLP